MKRGNTRPFRAPRASKPVATAHIKDKTVETESVQIQQTSDEAKQDSDDDDVPIVHKIPTYLRMCNEREADETAKFGEPLRWSSDSEGDEVPIMQTLMRALKEPTKDVVVEHKDIGMKIARDFGVKGVFLGEVVAVEYDSEDVDKNEDIYVVEYTDGDREDMNKEELGYANEFYVQVSGLEDDTPEGSLHTESGEEECYVPSPPVCLFISSPLYIIPFRPYRRKKAGGSRPITTTRTHLLMRNHLHRR